MTERHSFCAGRWPSLIWVLLAAFLLCDGVLLASDQSPAAGTTGHKFVSLNHLSPERGKEFLARLQIGTVSRLPGTEALLVTAEPTDLQKAVAILGVVDTPEEYDMKELASTSTTRVLPSNEQIANAVGGLSIGTFAKPPRSEGQAKAIIDWHGGVLVAIAPIFQLQDIKLAVELGPEVLAQRRAVRGVVQATAMAEPNNVADKIEKTEPSGAAEGQPDKIALPEEMRKKLEDMRQRAAKVRAQRQAEQSAKAELAAAPRATPEPATQDLSAGLLGQVVTPPLVSAGARQGGETAPAVEPQGVVEAGSDREAVLEPGQLVPREPGQAGALQVAAAPESAGVDASDVAVEPSEGLASYEPALALVGDRAIDLNLPEKLPVIQLLDLVGKYLNLSYLYDPAEVTGEVTLKLNGELRGSMKVKDLYLLLESVLQFKGLVMTRHKGNVVKILPIAKALDADPLLVDPSQRGIEAGDAIVTRVFVLEHIDTDNAQKLLDNMKLSVGITPIPEGGKLIVTAYAHRMARIEQLLEMVDRPGEPRKFRFRQLRYTMAKTLAEKVKALAEQLESVSVTVATEATTTQATKNPGESEAAYRSRLARLRASQAAQARARASAAAQQGDQAKPGVYLDADERTNRILMIGIEDQLVVVDGLVDALDVEQQDLRTLELYRMKFVDAEEVSKKLQELGIITRIPESPMSTRITGAPRTAQQAAAQAARQTAAAAVPPGVSATEVTEEGLVEEPQVVVVESTNSLLVNATAEQHVQIKTIISYVDSETLENEIPYKIYPLENSSPSHLAEVLQSLIQEQVQDPESKIEKVVKLRKDEEITIVPDPNTYSLIVYASKKNQEWISNLVRQLDKRRPQVLIDVTLVEITKQDAFNYDLNVIESFPNLAHKSGFTGVGFDPNVISQIFSGVRDHFVDLQSNKGDFTGFYGDRHINVLLEAMQSKNYGRVLAKPKILVNDNEPGMIKTEDTTYVKRTSSIPVTSGTAGQSSTLIQTATDFDSYDAGITLNITPHISEGDLLRLDIELIRSDFRETADTERPPDTTTSEVNTAVTVPDGSTIILGGLIRLNQGKGGSKVPILGDLPLVGGLFRSVSNKNTESKLYVFVKAEIIRPAGLTQGMDDLEEISERNRLAFEKHELEFQNYESWPGLKARPMSPVRVLDAQ